MKKQRFSISIEKEIKLRRRIAPAPQIHRDKKKDYDRKENRRVENEEAE